MADTETNFAHLHDNGELFVANDLEAARGMCPVLGKLSLEEAGLLLELEAMGNAILAAQQEAQPKVKATAEAPKQEADKLLATKNKTEQELPAIIEATLSETAAQTTKNKHSTPLAEQSEHVNQEREIPQPAIHFIRQKAEDLRLQNILEATTKSDNIPPATVIEVVKPAAHQPTATPENNVNPKRAEHLKAVLPDEPPKAESHADNFEASFTQLETIDFVPSAEIADAIQTIEETLPEPALEMAHSEDAQPALDMVSFMSEMLPPLPDKTAETTSEASALTSIILPRELAEQLETLKPDEALIVRPLLNKLAQNVEILQQPHTAATPEQAVQAEKHAEEALKSLAEHLHITYSDSEVKAYVRQMVAEAAAKPRAETDSINYALSHYGTHEGLQQFTLSLKQFRKVAGSLHTVLGKFALFLSTLHPAEQTESY